MRVLIAPESFKGSISARGVADAIARGLLAGCPAGKTVVPTLLPIADGGEGTLDALVPPEGRIRVTVTGPDLREIEAEYGHLHDTAVIEMASAAGLCLLPENKRRAGATTTYGVGEMILDALSRGYKKILLTVGGSGTNDGGAGLFSALGARFLRADGSVFVPTGFTLCDVADIDLSGLSPLLAGATFTIATDVTNPLCGESGATRVYGRQKGATDAELDEIEGGMEHYAAVLGRAAGKDLLSIPGLGAGGGTPVPFCAFLGGQIRSGIETVFSALGFRDKAKCADYIVTGEGRLDGQTFSGKVIGGVQEE